MEEYTMGQSSRDASLNGISGDECYKADNQSSTHTESKLIVWFTFFYLFLWETTQKNSLKTFS